MLPPPEELNRLTVSSRMLWSGWPERNQKVAPPIERPDPLTGAPTEWEAA